MQKFLTDISTEILDQVKELAELFFSPKQIAIMLELDIEAMIYCCETTGNVVYTNYWGGRLQSELELRKSIIKLARSGSSPAQTMAMDIFNKSKLELLDR